jgi:hypothetical protein
MVDQPTPDPMPRCEASISKRSIWPGLAPNYIDVGIGMMKERRFPST